MVTLYLYISSNGVMVVFGNSTIMFFDEGKYDLTLVIVFAWL